MFRNNSVWLLQHFQRSYCGVRKKKTGFPIKFDVRKHPHGSSYLVKSPVFQRVDDQFFFNWDSLHARLNSHYKAWSYKKKKHKKIKAYRKSLQKEPTVNRCLLILDLKPFRS